MPTENPTTEDELSELYSDENLSRAIRDILHSANHEFDVGSDEYDENVKSRYLLLARRIRNSYTARIDTESRDAQLKGAKNVQRMIRNSSDPRTDIEKYIRRLENDTALTPSNKSEEQ